MSDYLRKKSSKERGWSKEEDECNHENRGFDRNCDEIEAYDDAGERIYEKVICGISRVTISFTVSSRLSSRVSRLFISVC